MAGEASAAMEYATMLELPASSVRIDPDALAEQALHRARTFLQLPIPFNSMSHPFPQLLIWTHFIAMAYMYGNVRDKPHAVSVLGPPSLQAFFLWTKRKTSCPLSQHCPAVLCWVWTLSGNHHGLEAPPRPAYYRQGLHRIP